MKGLAPSHAWYVVAALGIAVGAYPILYAVVDMRSYGLLALKGSLLEEPWYLLAFYAHISGGAVALLSGWSQFKRTLRNKRIQWHRRLGKTYVISVLLIGAPAGALIAFYAEGGLSGAMGFLLMAITWWTFTWTALARIRAKDIQGHLTWMVRSYAVCFAAVTLRLWMPLFTAGFGYSFEEAYPMIAWLSWVPNLFVAEWIISRNWVRA